MLIAVKLITVLIKYISAIIQSITINISKS
jgi:hypothetical protein